MKKCVFPGCKNSLQYNNTKHEYCIMHIARIRRHGYPELKRDAYQTLERIPHKIVDKFILKHGKEMFDKEIAKMLRKKGFKGATAWTIGYRRRKLGGRKYLRGEIQKYKAWVRAQAIKKYGKICELCGYNMTIDTHHITPKYQGGKHEIDNLMVICPNCHGLITRGYIILNDRDDIPKIRVKILHKLKGFYNFL